mmetsp:Transcript_26245/g.66137  ORF Transcript_26245/g.66137 Transcript_26245/m.66137 type:complete len:269 (+) Transcript_26245:414-1220(+)
MALLEASAFSSVGIVGCTGGSAIDDGLGSLLETTVRQGYRGAGRCRGRPFRLCLSLCRVRRHHLHPLCLRLLFCFQGEERRLLVRDDDRARRRPAVRQDEDVVYAQFDSFFHDAHAVGEEDAPQDVHVVGKHRTQNRHEQDEKELRAHVPGEQEVGPVHGAAVAEHFRFRHREPHPEERDQPRRQPGHGEVEVGVVVHGEHRGDGAHDGGENERTDVVAGGGAGELGRLIEEPHGQNCADKRAPATLPEPVPKSRGAAGRNAEPPWSV